jgi:hypothetical protein
MRIAARSGCDDRLTQTITLGFRRPAFVPKGIRGGESVSNLCHR